MPSSCSPDLASICATLTASLDVARVGIFGAGPVAEVLVQQLAAQRCSVQLYDDYLTTAGDQSISPTERLSSDRPEVVVLATLRSRERMRRRLRDLAYDGTILALPGEDNDPFAPGASDTAALNTFKGRHKDQPAVIIGNGPSLRQTDPRLLSGVVTFGANSIFLLPDFAPNYYCVEDRLVAEDRAAIIDALPWTKFFPADLRRYLNNGIFFHGQRVPKVDKFSEDLTRGAQVNATVTYSLLQIAYFMGCNPVYLIGLDHRYQVTLEQAKRDGNILTSTAHDPNHFHPDYFGPGLRWHDPQVPRMEAAYELARQAFEKDGREVFNATAGGALNVFERRPFAELTRQPR